MEISNQKQGMGFQNIFSKDFSKNRNAELVLLPFTLIRNRSVEDFWIFSIDHKFGSSRQKRLFELQHFRFNWKSSKGNKNHVAF